jgi:hypothetical protein
MAQAYPATDYCAAAKAGIRSAGGNWDAYSCDQIKAMICADPTLFVGADPIRIWACGSGNGNGGGTTTGGNNTMILALAGIAAVGAVALAMSKSATKKVMAVRVK